MSRGYYDNLEEQWKQTRAIAFLTYASSGGKASITKFMPLPSDKEEVTETEEQHFRKNMERLRQRFKTNGEI